MKLKIYQIDAFANNIFEGNPAAICPLDSWISDEVMQNIAQENNLSETAFFVKDDNGFHIRWFSPSSEVDLCGHATLASAYVIYKYLDYKQSTISFSSKSGELKVYKDGDLFTLDFPAIEPIEIPTPKEITKAFAKEPIGCMKGMDYIAIFDNIDTLKPNEQELMKLDLRGVIVTSKSNEYDFVARVFAPRIGISEDAVTGSAYTQLVPYWTKVLNKDEFFVKQLSKRGGELQCKKVDDRVYISGKAVEYMSGEISI
jgi:predicted PhzF superfamily epimerase YddE/YHI9